MSEEKPKIKLSNPFADHTSKKEKEENEKKQKDISKRQKIKIGIFALLIVSAGVISWYSLARILNNGLTLETGQVFASLITLLFPVLSFCFWVALVGLASALIDKRKLIYPILFISILPVFIFFGFDFYTLLVLAFLCFAFIYFTYGVKKEEKDRVTFHINKVIKIHLGLTLILCVTGVTIVFYSQLIAGKAESDLTMSDAVANTTANLANVFLESQFKNYDPDLTLDEFILSTGQDFMETVGPQLGEDVGVKESFTEENIVSQLEGAIASGQVSRDELPPDVLTKLDDGKLTAQDIVDAQATNIFSDQISKARDDFLAELGVEAEGSDKISEVVKKIISSKLSEGLSGYDYLLPPFLAISLFFSLVIFLFVYKIFTKIFALLLYMIMLLANVVVISKQKGDIETVEFS